uniref:NADH dehydrogenase subunit 3 n=1 Tax=Macropsis hainanensis TaxID=3035245 RepID=UPI002410E801|nr:NADH dehydrogenase subunit 3 [Macropsis hainanensis]WEP24712.1 NADH dehydrogenase subunit 3 [Macropsis hainanensis]
MNKLLIYMSMLVFITTILIMLINLISNKSITDKQKISPFECGFNPMSNKRLPFSIHFFLIAAIFLIFDVEIIIIIPMIMTIKYSMMLSWLMTSVSFIMVLMMGLYHEWINGMLDWTK